MPDEVLVPTAPATERLAFSIAEAAQATGLCERTLINYASMGKLKVRRKGRRCLVLRSELERFLNRDDPVSEWRPKKKTK
jgi:hypothetical protein